MPDVEELSQEEVNVCDQYFRYFDEDHDGLIPVDVLPDLIRALGQNPSEAELDTLVQHAEFDREGILDFGEFLYLWAEYRKTREEIEDELLVAFQTLDKQNKGTIDQDKIVTVLTSVGEPMSEEEVKALLDQVTVDDNGQIEYQDIIHMVTNHTAQLN